MSEQFTVLALAPDGDNSLVRACYDALRDEFGLTSAVLVSRFRMEGVRVLTVLTEAEAMAAVERVLARGAGCRVIDAAREVVAEVEGSGVVPGFTADDEDDQDDDVEGEDDLVLEQHHSPELPMAQIDRLYEDLPRLGHYELLGLTPEASAEQIQMAFHNMALFMHPDRHITSADDDLKERLHAIYKRVATCYQVLMNPDARREYDVQLRLAEREAYEASRAAERAERVPEEQAAPAAEEPSSEEPRPEQPRGDGPVRVTRSSDSHSPARQPVDVLLEDTAPAPEEEDLPTPADRPGGAGHDRDDPLPAASAPLPEEAQQATGELPRPVRPTPQPRPPASPPRPMSVEEPFHGTRVEAAGQRPLSRVLAGVAVALCVGAVVPALYSGYAYFSQMEPLQQELARAEAAVARADDPAEARARVKLLDGKLSGAVRSHLLFTTVFWGLLSMLVGVMWFRRH